VSNERPGFPGIPQDPGPDGQLVCLVADLLRERGLDQLGYIAGDVDVLAVALDYAPTVGRCSC
jgi:hypothetical protein